MNAREDWYQVDSLGEDAYAIWELDSYACYLIEGTEKAVLVDTGVGVGDLRGIVKSLTEKPIEVLVTHSHWDHIGNAVQFDDVAAHPLERAPDGTLAIDGVSDEFVHRPAQALAGWEADDIEFPDAFDPESFGVDPVRDVADAYAGDVVDLGDRVLELVAIPGHSPGQLGVLDRANGVLYGADIVGSGHRLLALFDHTSLRAYRASVRRVYDLYRAGAFDTVATGHTDPLSGDGLDVFADIADGFTAIMTGAVTSERVETNYGPANEYTFDGFAIVTD